MWASGSVLSKINYKTKEASSKILPVAASQNVLPTSIHYSFHVPFYCFKSKMCQRRYNSPHVSWSQCSALKTQMHCHPNAICALLHSVGSLRSLPLGCSVLPPALSTCCLPRPHPSYLHLQIESVPGSAGQTGRGAWRPGHAFWAERFTTWNRLNSLPIKWLDGLLCWQSCITVDAREGECARIERVLIQRPGLLDIPTGKPILI